MDDVAVPSRAAHHLHGFTLSTRTTLVFYSIVWISYFSGIVWRPLPVPEHSGRWRVKHGPESRIRRSSGFSGCPKSGCPKRGLLGRNGLGFSVLLGRKCPPRNEDSRWKQTSGWTQKAAVSAWFDPARITRTGFGHSCWRPVDSNNFVKSMEGKLKHSLTRSISINKKVVT